MKRIVLALIAVPLLTASVAEAQGDWWWGAEYTVSVPLGATKEFTDNTSWRGATLEARKTLSQNLTAGLLFGWYTFNEVSVGTASLPGIDVTGVPYTYLNSFPIQATAHYYLGKPRGTRVHIGGGAGVTINERRLDVGLYRIQDTKTQFSVFPEIGVSIPLNWSLRGVLAVRYNYSLKSGDMPAQEYVGISVGLAWN
jgi:hypothetical protein